MGFSSLNLNWFFSLQQTFLPNSSCLLSFTEFLKNEKIKVCFTVKVIGIKIKANNTLYEKYFNLESN